MGRRHFPLCLAPQCAQGRFQGCFMLPQPDLGAGPGARSPTHCPEMWFWFGLCDGWGSCAEFPWGRREFGHCNSIQCKPLSWRMPCDRRGFDQPHLQHSRTCSWTRIVLHVSADYHCAHSHGRAQQLFHTQLCTNDPHSPHSCLLLLWERIKNTWRARKWDLCWHPSFPSLLETVKCRKQRGKQAPFPLAWSHCKLSWMETVKVTKTECQGLATQL